MDFIEFLEKVCDIKLFEYQKQFLRNYDKAQKEGKRFIFKPARYSATNELRLIAMYHILKEQGGETEKCKTDISTG